MFNRFTILGILAAITTLLFNFSPMAQATFTIPLKIGSRGSQVAELQQILKRLGFYQGPVTGYFGPITKRTVIKFQREKNIFPPIGNVGPLTRNHLNKLSQSLSLIQTPSAQPSSPQTSLPDQLQPPSAPPAPSAETPTIVQQTPSTQITPNQTPKIKIFLMEDANTCIVGNNCSDNDCVNIKDLRTDQIVKRFSKQGLLALPPNRITPEQRNSAYCMNLKFNSNEVDSIKNEINSFKNKIVEYSGNKLNPEIQIIENNNGAGIEMEQYGASFWLPPGGVHEVIRNSYSRDTDFVFVITDIKDPNLGTYFDPSLCDGSVGSQFNYGIGYTWIPKGQSGNGCANSLTLLHSFLHQLANAINKISPPANFTSYGNDNYTYNGLRLSCQTTFNSPYSYFPDADVAPLDPDFDSCRGNFGDNWIAGYCSDLIRQGFDGEECNRRWDKHLLGDHLPSVYTIIGNACRNGKRDFDETGIDNGGQCSIYP